MPIAVKEMLSAREVFSSLQNPKLVLSLFVTSLIIRWPPVPLRRS
nr:drug efflux system protein MdtG [Klebsiella pneumoniae]